MKNRLLIRTMICALMLSIMHGACAMDKAIVPVQETNFLTRQNFSIGNITRAQRDWNAAWYDNGMDLSQSEVTGFEINQVKNQSDRVTIRLANNTCAPYQLHKEHLAEFEGVFYNNQKVEALSFSIVPHAIFQQPNDYYVITRKTFTEFTNYNPIATMHDTLSDESTNESSDSENAYETSDSSSSEKEEPQENSQPDTVQTPIDIPKLNLGNVQAPERDIIVKTINNTEEKPVTTATTYTTDKTKFFIGGTSFLVAALAFLYHCYPEMFSSESLSALLQKFSFNNSAQ